MGCGFLFVVANSFYLVVNVACRNSHNAETPTMSCHVNGQLVFELRRAGKNNAITDNLLILEITKKHSVKIRDFHRFRNHFWLGL